MVQNSCGGANFGTKSILIQSPNFLNGQGLSNVVRHPNCGGLNINVGFNWILTDFTTLDVLFIV